MFIISPSAGSSVVINGVKEKPTPTPEKDKK
jgi:hypothetical protein